MTKHTGHSNSERFDVIGCEITRANMLSAIERVKERISSGKGGYICFTNVHASVMGRRDTVYRSALNNSFMTLPDGKPLYWVARAKGLQNVGHVPGPDFLPAFLAKTRGHYLKHYFLGSTPEVLATLTTQLKSVDGDIEIVGTHSPPFRELTPEETEQIISQINNTKPDIIWIGLGAPKQEMWMAEHWRSLQPAILMGVGAAFDFHAGSVKRAPSIFTKLGFEWLYRIFQEPRRLWKRYLVTNSSFIFFLILDKIESSHN